jgi:hypothetical protein
MASVSPSRDLRQPMPHHPNARLSSAAAVGSLRAEGLGSPRTLVRDVAEPRAQVGAADGRGHPGPAAELPSCLEARDVADLDDHQHRDIAAHAADLAEHLDIRILLGAGVDLARGQVNLAREVGDQRERAVEPAARALRQLERVEKPLGPNRSL